MLDKISASDLNLDNISNMLADAVIEVDRSYDDCLYVTGGEFPVFWSLEPSHDALVFWTFLDAEKNADEGLCVKLDASKNRLILA